MPVQRAPRRRGAVAALGLLAAIIALAVLAAEVVGTAVQVVNDVRATPRGGATKPVKPGDSILLGTRLDTGRASALTLTFPPGGRIDLGPETSVVFDRKTVDEATGKNESGLSLLLGKLRLSLRKLQQQVSIETPHAVAGVKGTVVRMLAAPLTGTFVAVDEGVVGVRSKAGGDEVEVHAGQWVLVPPGGLPTRPAPLNRRAGPLEDPPLIDRFDLQFEPPKPPPRQ